MDETSSDSRSEWIIIERSEGRCISIRDTSLSKNKNRSRSTKEKVEPDLSEPGEVPLQRLPGAYRHIIQEFVNSIEPERYMNLSTTQIDENQVRNTGTSTSTCVNRGDRSEMTMPPAPARTQNEDAIMGYVDQLIGDDHADIEREVEERFARIMENQRRARDSLVNINLSRDRFDHVVTPEEEVLSVVHNDSDVEILEDPCTSTDVTKTRKRRVGTCLRSGKRMRKDLASTKIEPEPNTIINPPVSQNSILGSLECSICLDQLTNKEVSSTMCGHVFCTPCIKAAIKSSKACPNCRTKLTLKKIHPLFL